MQTRALACLIAMAVSTAAQAQSPVTLLKNYELAARASPGFTGFSAARGAEFFRTAHGNEWRCTSCHDNPMAPGKHAKTGKPIGALAPAANAERFTAADKSEKWFRRNCNDVLGRECTAREKGDVLAYLLSLGS